MRDEMNNSHSGKILVVDDITANLQFLTKILMEQGYTVYPASDGELALAFVKSSLPDLILLDIRMPVMDGYEVCRRLKSDERTQRIPVIFISALDEADEKVKGIKVGAVDYITKPFKVLEVLARVEMHLALHGLQKQLELQNMQLKKEIDERRRAELKLRHAHGEITQLFASIPSIMVGVTSTGKILHWNTAAETIFGKTAADVLGDDMHELLRQWKLGEISEAMVHCQEKKIPTSIDKIRFCFLDGKTGFLSFTISPVLEERNDVSGLIILASDITERHILESQLLQVQKLKSIGQLAAGVAHEINTPIQFVGDNIRFLLDAFNDLSRFLDLTGKLLEAIGAGESVKEFAEKTAAGAEEIDLEYLREEIPQAIKQALEGTERVSRIVLAMKEFSHPGAVDKTAIDINKAIENTFVVSRNEWKYVADLVMDLDPSLPLVSCIPQEFNQVILNLIVNAAHAIADVKGDKLDMKGTITVETKNLGSYVEIRISDTGSGIPEKIRSRIFDPFFTTKEVGKGTGQGLAISFAIIADKHDGTISFDTEKGKGTTFIITLPIERKNLTAKVE